MMDYDSIFIQMLQARGLTDNTIRSYKTYINPYLTYLKALRISPDNASWQVMRDYLSWIQNQRGLSNRTVNMIISYLQFFHTYVLHKTWDKTQIPFKKFDVFLPFVPSRNQVQVFINAVEDPKAKLALSMLYATGLRLSELRHLHCEDISHSSHRIHVVRSKNHRDRYVPLPESIWTRILNYWYSLPKGKRPKEWLFTQQYSLDAPMDPQWIQNIIRSKREELSIKEKFTAHSLRHAYATHSYENGMDLLELQSFLGHKSLPSTLIYVHLANAGYTAACNPFDQIGGGLLD